MIDLTALPWPGRNIIQRPTSRLDHLSARTLSVDGLRCKKVTWQNQGKKGHNVKATEDDGSFVTPRGKRWRLAIRGQIRFV
jgi:hypothetical protein